MLLQLWPFLILFLQGIEAYVMNSSFTQNSLNTLNHRDIDSHQYAQQDRIRKNLPEHPIHYLTSKNKVNLVPVTQNLMSQSRQSPYTSDIDREQKQVGVEQINYHFIDLENKKLPNNIQATYYQDNFGKKINKSQGKEDIAFQNKKPIGLIYKELQANDQVHRTEANQQEESQFINREQKTLYLKLIEVIDKLARFFSVSKKGIQIPNSTININSTYFTEQMNSTFTQIKPLQIQVPQNMENSAEIPKQVILATSMKSFDTERSQKLINDTQILAKRRKKLYFIICTLSFGAASIFLIKLLEERNDKRRHWRDEIIKIPSEQFYIQEI